MTLEQQQRMERMAHLILRAGGGTCRLDLPLVTECLRTAASHWRIVRPPP